MTAMTEAGGLKVTTRGDREIVMTRTFDAPRALSSGEEVGMGSVYREVVRPERLVNTETRSRRRTRHAKV